MDGRSGAAGTASGELRAGIEGLRGGVGVAYEARGYKQAGETDGRADGQVDGSYRAKMARRDWLSQLLFRSHRDFGSLHEAVVVCERPMW